MSTTTVGTAPPAPRHRRTLLSALIAASLAVVGIAGALLAPPAQGAVPSAPGWTLQWSDDFNGAAGTLPSSANWIFDLGHSYPGGPANWGTNEVQNFTDSTNNISLDGAGNLRITPLRDASGNWTSARIETRRSDFRPPAGGVLRMESRIQMPDVTGAAASGYWPAFWALGSPYRGNYQNWPGIGEYDVMENVNGLNAVYGTVHCGVNPGGPCNETTGIGNNRPCPNTTCQSGFHTYTFEWDTSVTPNQLRWYVDGVQYHSVNQNQVDATTWSNMTSHGYFMLLNVSIGGAFPDALGGPTPTAATEPGHPMNVDYVGVWTSSSGGGSYPSGYHQLVVQNSKLCVDVFGASVSSGAAIDQWGCGAGQANQEFQFNPVSGGYGELQNRNSGEDLAVYGASTSAGAQVIQYTQNGTANSLWQPIALSDGTWQFKNQKSGLCLDMTGNSTTWGIQFEQWSCKSSAVGSNQAFATQ
jgi:hypothetical protein